MKALVEIFSKIPDMRMERSKKYKLIDVITIVLCATIAGAEGYNQIEKWARKKLLWLRKFLDLPYGVPSHDTLNRVFSLLDPKEFQKALLQWVESVNILLDGKVVAIDGKTIRRSYDSKNNKKAVHLVSAWAHEAGMSLGQIQVDEHSNEITAVPELLKMLDLKGAIITLDAMGCQKEIAKQIVGKEADYVLALKQNHADLYDDIETYFKLEVIEADKITQTIEKDHGRIEKRIYSAASADWISKNNEWIGLKSIVKVESIRDIGGMKHTSKRYYLTTLDNVEKIAYAIRNHWSIENSLHWQLDVLFNEDQSRVRQENAAQNLALIRRMSLSMLKQDTSEKESLKTKRFLASIDDEYLLHITNIRCSII